MPNIYFMDSSAIVKHFIDEHGSESVRVLVEREQIFVSRLAQVEVASAISRWSRNQTPSVQISWLFDALDYYLNQRFEVVEIDHGPVWNLAVKLAKFHFLRGADSIQLACSLITKQNAGTNRTVFVSCDRELNNAAQAEGLTVLNPDLQA